MPDECIRATSRRRLRAGLACAIVAIATLVLVRESALALQSYVAVNVPVPSQGVISAIAADPSLNRLYVADVAANRVYALDGTTLSTIWVAPTGRNPVAVAVNGSGSEVWVADAADGEVSVLRSSDGTTIARAAAGRYPNGIALNDATTSAYISNRDSDDVTIVDEATHQVRLASLAVGAEPTGIAVNASANRVYVSNRRGHSVSVVDGLANTVVATIPLPDEPAGLATDPGFNKVFVGSARSTSVYLIDGATNSVVTTLSTWRWPESVAVDTTRHRAYASVLALGQAYAIDTFSNRIVATMRPPGSQRLLRPVAVNVSSGNVYTASADGFIASFQASGAYLTQAQLPNTGPGSLAVDYTSKRVYFTRSGATAVGVLDETTHSVVGPDIVISGGSSGLTGAAANPATSKVYVTTGSSVAGINELTGSQVADIPLSTSGSTPLVDTAANRIFFVTSAGLAVVNGATDTVAQTVAIAGCPFGGALDAAAGRLYVADVCSNSLTVFDSVTLAQVATIPVGRYPLSLDANPSTHRIYVAGADDDTVSVVDGSTNSVVTTVTLAGPRPVGVRVNAISNTVYVGLGGGAYRGAGVAVIDGLTNSVSYLSVGAGGGDLGVDPQLNRLYFSDGLLGGIVDFKTSPATTTPSGTNVSTAPLPGTAITFTSVATAGETAVLQTTTAPLSSNPGQFLSNGVYYDFSTTAVVSCPCTITVPYDPAVNPNPHLYHLAAGVWVDVTTNVDAVNRLVSGVVSSLSFFAVGAPVTATNTPTSTAPPTNTPTPVPTATNTATSTASSTPAATSTATSQVPAIPVGGVTDLELGAPGTPSGAAGEARASSGAALGISIAGLVVLGAAGAVIVRVRRRRTGA